MKQFFSARPWWANALLAFCAYMAIIYLPFDLFFKPVSDDQEVWFGILFSGWVAKWLAIPHWFVYAWGAYGFFLHEEMDVALGWRLRASSCL